MKTETIWQGGYFELSMEFSQEVQLSCVVQALRAAPNFAGFWQERTYSGATVSEGAYGLLAMEHQALPCLISLIETETSNWFDVAIPQGAFAKEFPYQYPLTIENNPWLVMVQEAFITLAKYIYEAHPFLLAMIGEEVSGYTTAQQFSAQHVADYLFIVPPTLYKRLEQTSTRSKLIVLEENK